MGVSSQCFSTPQRPHSLALAFVFGNLESSSKVKEKIFSGLSFNFLFTFYLYEIVLGSSTREEEGEEELHSHHCEGLTDL